MSSVEEINQMADAFGYRGEKREQYLEAKFAELAQRQREEKEAEIQRQEVEAMRQFELEKLRIQMGAMKTEVVNNESATRAKPKTS